MTQRQGLTDRGDHNPQQSPLEEGAFMHDVEKCIFSAEAIMSVTITTVYDDVALPCQQLHPDIDRSQNGTPFRNKSPRTFMNHEDLPSPLRPARPPQSLDRSQNASPDDAISPTIYELDVHPPFRPPNMTHKDTVGETRETTPDLVKPPRLPEDTRSSLQRLPRRELHQIGRRPVPDKTRKPEPSEASRPRMPETSKHSQILFHLNDIKNERGESSDSDNNSIVDPEPDFEDGFPAIVYLELITALQQDVQRELEAEEYDKAEKSHRKAMKYCTDREKKLRIPFENQTEMHETLAQIYQKQKQLDKAKRVLHRLLMQEKKDSDRKWRLYHTLAEIYQEQNRLPEAEKFAKRAYIGRDRSLEKGHNLILQSVSLLVEIYEQQGEKEPAEAFKRIYRSASSVSHQDRISNDGGLSYRSGSIVSQQPSISTQREDAFLNKSRIRWAPDAWVDSSSINAPTKSGETPMISAIATGDDELVRLMLQRGADVEARCGDEMTPLMHAINHGYNSIAELLLSRGAQVDAPTSGWTPLHRATELMNISMVNILLASGADIEAKSPKVFSFRKNALSRMKSPKPDDPDDDQSMSDNRGWTPLLRAASHGEEAMVRLFLDNGANIEARNPSNATPLICAAERQLEAIVDLLLSRGADVHAEDEFGWKPLHRALVNKGGERVAGLLLSRDANVNDRDRYRKTPLHHAIEKGDDQIVHFLLNAGADIEARDIAERTPLHTAIEARLEIMVHILLDNGADMDAMDKGGRNALSAANHALRKSPEIITLLAKAKKTKQAELGRGGGGSRRGSSNLDHIPSRTTSGSWWSRRSSKEKR